MFNANDVVGIHVKALAELPRYLERMSLILSNAWRADPFAEVVNIFVDIPKSALVKCVPHFSGEGIWINMINFPNCTASIKDVDAFYVAILSRVEGEARSIKAGVERAVKV